jgi:hypothetical protein
MKKHLSVLTILLLLAINSHAAIFVISGIYQGKNLFVQNPATDPEGTIFCTNDVYVNDVKVMGGITQGAFEVDLSNIRINSQVTVKITHKEGCKPRLLNPQVIKPSSLFHFNSFQVDKEHFIWSTRGEKPKGKYVLEYYMADKWVLVKEIPAKGSIILNNYDTDGVVTGTNKYRLKFVESDGHVHYSQIVEFSR